LDADVFVGQFTSLREQIFEARLKGFGAEELPLLKEWV
jgi:hypothetical protein